MKRSITLIIITVLCAVSLFAQTPEKFSYQAVVRNASNALVTDSPVGIRISLMQGGVNGSIVFRETHTAITNANGLVTISIGSGNLLEGSIVSIDWANGPYFLKTEIDPNGGSNYTISSEQQLLSVPYALYSKEAGNGFSGDYNDLTNRPQIPQSVGELTNDANYITMDSVPTNVSAFNNDAGYITMEQVPAQVNADWNATTGAAEILNKPTIPQSVGELANDANYITMDSVPTNVSAFNNDAGYITLAHIPAQVNADWNATTGAAEILNKPTIPQSVGELTNDANYITMDSVPTNVSAFTNDAGYLTGYTETDPQFNAWDKDYNDLTNKPNLFSGNYNDLSNKPTNADFGQALVRGMVNNAAGATDIAVTFNNYSLVTGGAVSIGFARNVPAGASLNINNQGSKPILWHGTALADGVIKANDRCLFMYNSGSDRYYLLAIDRWGADIDALAEVARTGNYNDLTNKPTIPQSVGELTNDANYITMDSVPTNVSAFNNDAGYITLAHVPAQVNADWNATTGAAQILNKPTIPTVPSDVSAFNNDAGYITAQDIPEIPSVPTNVSAFVNDMGYLTAIPDSLGGISVESDPVFSAWNRDYNDLTNLPELFSGDYNDLTNKPTIPAAQVNADWNATTGAAEILNKPTIPQSVGELTNDANYITMDSVPTNVSAFNNDAGYISLEQVPAQVNADWNATSGAAQILHKPTIPTVPSNVSVFNNDANYITNTGSTCDNALDLCNLMNTIEDLQNQVQELSNMINGSPYGTASSDTCPQRMVMIDGNPNVCYYGINQVNINLIAWVDGIIDIDATYTWYESGQQSENPNGNNDYYYSGLYEPTYNNPYIFTVKVTQSDGCSYTSAPFMVNVYDKPYATITGTADEVCTGGEVTLRANLQNYNDPMITYQWYETEMDNAHALPSRTHEIEHFAPTTTTDYIVKVTHLMDYSYNACDAYDTFRVEVTECDTTGGGGVDSKSCPGTPTVTDHEGNVYNTVQIGDQCWMKENLRTTTSPTTGTYLIPSDDANSTYTGKQARWYNNDSATYAPMNYGLLYNWNAAVDTFNTAYGETSVNTDFSNAVSVTFSGHRRGICPVGWHLPSDAEWRQLTNYVGSVSEYKCGGSSGKIAKALASETEWVSHSGECYPGDQSVTENNATDFSAVPAGNCNGSSFDAAGYWAYFWSATQSEFDPIWAYLRSLYYDFEYVDMSSYYKKDGYSVRCLRDETGTAVIDSKSCPGTPTVTDHEGNVYATVQIGNQCWMRDNLRTTTSPSTGTYLIPTVGTDYTFTGKQAVWYNNDSATYAPMNYGLLYNWNAAVDTFNTAYGETSVNTDYYNLVPVTFRGHRRGICPAGWHLPSDAEWTVLTSYVGSQSEYVCDNNIYDIAKALASTTGWYYDAEECGLCSVATNQSTNNASGFGAVPAGDCYGSSFNFAGKDAYFWSATQGSSNLAYLRCLLYYEAFVRLGYYYESLGCSVRCLRD